MTGYYPSCPFAVSWHMKPPLASRHGDCGEAGTEHCAGEAASRPAGERFVLGSWDMQRGIAGGYVAEWRAGGGLMYHSHPDVFRKLQKAFPQGHLDVLWEINQEAILIGIRNGAQFEYSMKGILTDDMFAEQSAIDAIWNGASVSEIQKIIAPGKLVLPARMKELMLLFEAGYHLQPNIDNTLFILSNY